MIAYRVPSMQHKPIFQQPKLFDLGIYQPKPIVSRRQLEQRNNSLRQLKLELEEENDTHKAAIKHLCKRLEESNRALMYQSEQGKYLVAAQIAIRRMRNRMKELGQKVVEKCNDYDRLADTIGKYKPDMRCIGPCGKVRRIEAFAKDADRPFGRDPRCNICQREKTSKWRKAKKLLTQNSRIEED